MEGGGSPAELGDEAGELEGGSPTLCAPSFLIKPLLLPGFQAGSPVGVVSVSPATGEHSLLSRRHLPGMARPLGSLGEAPGTPVT